MRLWSVGQAVQLRSWLELLSWRAEHYGKENVWPEYSELSCFACHHSIVPANESWRQAHGFPGRRPGDPAWNSSRYLVFSLLAKQIDPGAAQGLEAHMRPLAGQMNTLTPSRTVVESEATAAVPIVQRIAERLDTMRYDQELVLRMLREISSNAEGISMADERVAAQATMAFQSLYIAYCKEAKPRNAVIVQSAINGLFQQLESPSLSTLIDSQPLCGESETCCELTATKRQGGPFFPSLSAIPTVR